MRKNQNMKDSSDSHFVEDYVEFRRHIGADKFRLITPLTFYSRVHRKYFKVPPGYLTDFASIPPFLQSVIQVNNNTIHPSIIHDYGCDPKEFVPWELTQKEVDDLFEEAMDVVEVRWTKRRVMYRAVRLFQKLKYKLQGKYYG